MRLTENQIRLILNTVTQIGGAEIEVFLFGSRLNNAMKGGDLDLLIETPSALPLIQRAKLQMQLESLLSMSVHLVCKPKYEEATPFQILARNNGIKLTHESN